MMPSAVPETIPFAEADASFVYFAQPGKWWSIHLEVHLAGRVDPERLLSAARAACERHPMARARMVPFQRGERAYRWEIQEAAGAPELEIVDCVQERVSRAGARACARDGSTARFRPTLQAGAPARSRWRCADPRASPTP